MALVLKNIQSIVKLNMRQMKKDVNILRKVMDIDHFDVAVLFVRDDYIQKLNESYRGVKGATDVLAFPALEMVEPGVFPAFSEELPDGDEPSLGDVYLAPAFIQQQCKQHGDNIDLVLMATITHGLCHLLGHDHQTDAQQRLMVRVEESILDRFNALTGSHCKTLTTVGH